MIYVHSMSRAVQYYPEHAAFVKSGNSITFSALDRRVRAIAGELRDLGFLRGERLAFLLPNGTEYIELIYACSLLGVIAVPINTRYAGPEIDHVLEDASPKGLIRHSSLPKPTTAVEWERVLDEHPFEGTHTQYAFDFYEPDATLVLIYTSGTTGRPKGAALTHSNIFANIHDLHYWLG
ncbi:class I adenylate-forming enzyme family protein [Granulicella sp. S156]|uniref:AMP-binding protein n=1 Tax=Granulicella sp. S156 TaxID=1747224 RepID=UPI00131B8DEF|nr:class I adenylate-forming enzyme family protein [Granulicella sp. S156]